MNALSWVIEGVGLDGGFATQRRYNWEAIFQQDTVWITEDGRVLLLSQIEDDHLTNVLPFVLRRAWTVEHPEALPLVQALRRELARRGL